MSEKRDRDFSRYEAMETEELEEIMRWDAEAPEGAQSDTELILYILEVLSSRRNTNNITGKTAQESWESFQKYYLDDEYTEDLRKAKKHRVARPWGRLAAAAAAIVLAVGIPLSVKAFGWENIRNAFARWSSEMFSFVSSGNAKVSAPMKEDQRSFSELQEMLLENNRDASIVPTWIPEGFVLEEIEKDLTPVQEVYRTLYMSGERILKIRVQSFLDTDLLNVEIEGEPCEIYTASGTDYYIFENADQIHAVWVVDSYECMISGEISIEELKMMIDSIEKG